MVQLVSFRWRSRRGYNLENQSIPLVKIKSSTVKCELVLAISVFRIHSLKLSFNEQNLANLHMCKYTSLYTVFLYVVLMICDWESSFFLDLSSNLRSSFVFLCKSIFRFPSLSYNEVRLYWIIIDKIDTRNLVISNFNKSVFY
jgi:hypothetical protein